MGKFKDLTGQRFGRLTVVKHIGRDKNGTKWECLCDCGQTTAVYLSNLTRGHTTSCGCYVSEASRKANKKYNKYDISGEYGVGLASNTGNQFYFDLDDYELINKYCWCEKPDGYLVAGEINNGHKMVLMHQLISGKKYQDHINGNKRDNRKSNLREATHSQNNMNKGLQKNNKSGITGVYFDKTYKKWHAQIKINRKNISLGYYVDKADAVKARKVAEEKYFGEFAYKGQL